MIAAVAVLVSHAYPLALGAGASEPLEGSLGMNLGTLAVISFFAISGYFISQSFHARNSVLEFAVARILRIYPGLLLVCVLSTFLVGPIFTKLDPGAYFSDSRTFLYVPRNLSLKWLQYDLPGVFGSNPYPSVINGSLWTLFYEVTCYAGVVLVALLGLAPRPRRFACFLIAYVVFYLIVLLPAGQNQILAKLPILRNAHLLVLSFVVGMSLYQFQSFRPFRSWGLGAGAVAALVSQGEPWFDQIFVIGWSYAILYLGFLRIPPLLSYNRLGDYSYGMYVYAFPVEQIVIGLRGDCPPLALMTWSLAPTLLLAVLSWHLLEEPALARKAAAADWLRRAIAATEIVRRQRR